MSSKSSTSLILAILAGVILGGVLGYYLPDTMWSLSFVGRLFLNALHILVIPVIIASVIVGIAALADLGRVNRATGKTLLYFAVTSAIAVIVGFALTWFIQPGAGVNTAGFAAPSQLGWVSNFSLSEMLGSILPDNLFLATAQGQLLGLVIFSLFFGATLIALGDRGKSVIGFFQGVNEVMMGLVRLVLLAAPIGLLFLVGGAVAAASTASTQYVSSVGLFSLTVLAGFIIQGLIVLPLALKFLANRPFWNYLAGNGPALGTAFGTGSSAATLPVTYSCVVEKSDVDERAAAITLPLGSVINMNGTALYLVIAAFFCAQAFAVDLSWLQILTILVVGFLLSLGASLVPHGSLTWILGIVLFSASVPSQAYTAISLLLVVDWFFERLRATLNVWGDMVGAAVIGETFEFKTARRVRPVTASRPPGTFKRGNGAKRRDRKPSSHEARRKDQKDRKPQQDSRRRDDRKDRKRRGDGRSQRKDRGRRFDEGRTKPPEKPSSFEITKPPYHVLDTELRGKKPVDSDIPDKHRDERELTGEGLSKETIERERAKVAAQLAQLGQKDERSEQTELPPYGTESDISSGDTRGSDASGESEHRYPRVDFDSSDIGESTGKESAGIGADEEALADTRGYVEESPVVPPAPSYGRGKSRKGPPPKSGPSEKEPVEGQEEPKPEFSAENISFGRSKRRKPSS